MGSGRQRAESREVTGSTCRLARVDREWQVAAGGGIPASVVELRFLRPPNVTRSGSRGATVVAYAQESSRIPLTDIVQRVAAALADRYVFEREIGRGGMATVYLARDIRHGRSVALKLLRPELATLQPDRFLREIRVAARLQHPHILPVFDSGSDAGMLWYTMPYVEGESLRDRLRREGQIGVGEALRLTSEVADALDCSHALGVVHRDVKPENILLARGHAFIADFGVASALEGDGEGLTGTGLAVGTPAYMSPEQASAGTVDARSDQYGLACVLYEMLAGELPYGGPTPQVILSRRFREPAPDVRAARPGVPAPTATALMKALAAVPGDRYPDMASFARAVGSTWDAEDAKSPTRTRPRAFASRVAGVAAGLAILLAALGAFFVGQRWSPNESTEVKAIAVLPFENQGASADAYFADGMSDAIRGKLAALPRLRVIARASSTQYRQGGKTLREIGRELGVQYVLTATVGWDKGAGASRVRVSPELIQVAGVDQPVTRWQQPFDEVLSDVFAVQSEIAGKVAAALDIALDPSEQRTLSQAPTASLQAYDAFLQAEANELGTNEPAALKRAVAAYDRAVAADPGFAPGWSQLSRTLAHLSYFVEASSSVRGRARVAAERAVRIAPQYSGGWIALGDVASKIDFDPARALARYSHARRLGATGPDVLTSSAFAERILGRWDSVEAHLREAYSLDPRSVEAVRTLVETLILFRKHSEALALCDHALAMAPRNLSLIGDKTNIYLARGDIAGARAWIETAKLQVGRDAIAAFLGAYGDTYWALDPEDQRRLLELLPEAFGSRKSWAEVLAQVYALHGDTARARAYADSALQVTERDCAKDAMCHALKAVQLALAGRSTEAVREGELAVKIAPVSKDAYLGPYLLHQLARVYILAGQPTKAVEAVETLVRVPYYVSRAWIRIDPSFAPLRGDPRLERLLANSGDSPTKQRRPVSPTPPSRSLSYR